MIRRPANVLDLQARAESAALQKRRDLLALNYGNCRPPEPKPSAAELAKRRKETARYIAAHQKRWRAEKARKATES